MSGASSHRGRDRWRLVTGLFRASTTSVQFWGSFLRGMSLGLQDMYIVQFIHREESRRILKRSGSILYFQFFFKTSFHPNLIMPKEAAAHHAGLLAELGATCWFGSVSVSILANAVLWPETWSPNTDSGSMWRQPPAESPGITHLQTQHRLLKAPYT